MGTYVCLCNVNHWDPYSHHLYPQFPVIDVLAEIVSE